MRIAVPLKKGLLSMHFGHCESFAILDVDPQNKQIITKKEHPAPPHEPGILPHWLGEQQVNIIITGGMGKRAKDMFTERDIAVIVGASSEHPEVVVQNYLENTLFSGPNACSSEDSTCSH